MKQDHEAVRQLAINIGVRPAARQLGLNEDRVRQWSKREKWFAKPKDTQNATVTTVTRPGDVLLSEIETNGRETKLSLSRATKRLAKDSEEATLRHSRHVKDVVQSAALINPELYASKDKDPATVAVNIAILGS